MHPDDRTKHFRKCRFSNARHFFLKSPLGLLAEAVAHDIPLNRALHCAGPSLVTARPVRVLTEQDLEHAREYREAILERYQEDHDRAAARTLREYGVAYTGD